MPNLMLCSLGSDKVKMIRIITNNTGLGLKESKAIVDTVGNGQEYMLQNIPDDRFNSVVEEFTAMGAVVKELNDFENAIIERETYVQQVKACVPLMNPNLIHKLDRQDTMKVLVEAGRIARELEELELDIAELSPNLTKEREKVKEFRTALSKKAAIKIWTATMVAGGIVCVGNTIAGVLTGFIVWVIMNATVGKKDRALHADENNARADGYYEEHVVPLERKFNEVCAKRDEVINGGKKQWAIDVVGQDMFYSACIEDLYNLVKSRRADNLKEALNLYDDVLHKERMEEMQAEIKKASEISARESVKQTALARRTARAARTTAANTREIERNTRRFR